MEQQDRNVRLVGRAAELEAIRAELRRSSSGEFRVVVVEGPAGVGKSRLISEAARLPEQQSRVIGARSFRLGATSSFGPWIEALQRHRLATGETSEGLLPAETGEMNRARVLEEILEGLRRLSQDQPLLVAMDDVHLSDDSSWEALRYFGRRLWDRPLAVIAAARPEGLRSNPLAMDVLLALEDEGLLRRLSLRPLNLVEMGDLARAVVTTQGDSQAVVPQRLVDWLMEKSLGHPLFAISLLRSVVAEGGSLSDPELSDLPVSLRERVGLELHSLSAREREILDLLAIFDRRSDLGELAEAHGGSFEELVSDLDRLTEMGLVTATVSTEAANYEIAHPLVQEAVYEMIGTARRLVAHRSVASCLQRRGRWGEAAGHFARSAPTADDESIEALCSAIRLAEDRGLYREALAVLAALLDVLPEGDTRWKRVFESLDWNAEWVIGHLAEGDATSAVKAMHRIETVCRGDPTLEGTVQLHLASFLSIGTGQLAAAEKACQRAIALFETAAERNRRLLAENEMAWILACRGDLAGAAALADHILEGADEGDDPGVAVQAGGSAAYALAVMGLLAEAEERFDRADSLARQTDNTYRRVWGLAQRSIAHLFQGRTGDAVDQLEQAMEIDYSMACDALALERLAFVRLMGGELFETTRLIEESGSRRATRGSRRRSWGLAIAARAYAEMGKYHRAERNLAQASETYGEGEILDWSAWCPWASGFLALQRGDFATSLAEYRRAADRYRAMGAIPLEALVLVDLIDAAMEGDEAGTAREASERMRHVASRVESPVLDGLRALAIAVLAETAEEAVFQAGSAAEALKRWGFPLYASIALHWKGKMGLDTDDEALDSLQTAARLAGASGAIWRRERSLSLLVEVGRRGQRLAGAVRGPEALTSREREVVRLAARGLTARDIAIKLFIGVRTVETHLANAYPKLGVAGKKELVLRGEDLGLR